MTTPTPSREEIEAALEGWRTGNYRHMGVVRANQVIEAAIRALKPGVAP